MSVIMPNASKTRGFTIVELMVTLAVAAILMGIAIPAFNEFIAQRTMASRVNDFVVAVTYARSEAARRGGIVSIQAVDASDGDNEWGPGYCVVEGNPGNCVDALRRFEAMDDATLNAVGAGFDGQAALSFNARGMLTPQPPGPGTIELCAVDEDVDPGRVISIGVIGRADVAELECHGG
jgi:type IV fimbrial biogenesis protein FimT